MDVQRLFAAVNAGFISRPPQTKHEQSVDQNRTIVNQSRSVQNTDTDISYDKEANVFVFKWTDSSSKEVIQQIPAEAMIELAKVANKMLGSVINTKA